MIHEYDILSIQWNIYINLRQYRKYNYLMLRDFLLGRAACIAPINLSVMSKPNSLKHMVIETNALSIIVKEINSLQRYSDVINILELTLVQRGHHFSAGSASWILGLCMSF